MRDGIFRYVLLYDTDREVWPRYKFDRFPPPAFHDRSVYIITRIATDKKHVGRRKRADRTTLRRYEFEKWKPSSGGAKISVATTMRNDDNVRTL